ncbi:hypothetical protein IDJ81_10685 [Tsuneonella flava]|uniref:Secreted protein n=1 Tax=Tsuneonella flava TaxID=2055955 RepID=A0ABX7K747_9SPHN|nr:hypothetical protein [Tsuneonella flava]QSB43819.1 hypothetical protein IDJ81_10685 [Tsuneonella flava]
MNVRTRLIGGAIALIALAQPQVSLAQDCISKQEVGSLVMYMMPVAIDSVDQACSAHLSPDGFLASGAAEMRERYAAMSDKEWPNARRALFKFARNGRPAEADDPFDFSAFPDEAVRPLVTAMFGTKIRNAIKVDDCANYEEALQVFSPIEPHDVANLVVFIASVAKVKNPSVCKEPQE